ncbi:hypothetical protein O6H91_04G062700 [Diphasiastrum complanatum]|uniref:Uncharacterized protein n=1 Tax=Diphasiastrum complanatum TaxID=34168 RepID=A0ACC2DXM6_DIPCM|nr:hypothetical protein O6H91_04G062700 [Diphasiastrum complanatum]
MANQAFNWAFVAPLLLLNFILYAISLALAGLTLNGLIDGELLTGKSGNAATPYLIIFSCIAGVIGIASVLIGVQGLISGKNEHKANAAASGLIAWALTVLAMGIASKHIEAGRVHGKRDVRALEAFAIILSGTQLLYLILPHVGVFLEKQTVSKTEELDDQKPITPTAI